MLTDYLARVEQAVRDNISKDTRIIGLIETEVNEREDYWECIYTVAWTHTMESGTHRVNINSKNESALFYGNYQMTPEQAIIDLFDRTNI